VGNIDEPRSVAEAVFSMIACDDSRPLSRCRLVRRYIAMAAIRFAVQLDERVFDALVEYFDWQLRQREAHAPLAHRVRRIRVVGSDGSVTCPGGHHGSL
jgi:hypothetical protein